MENPTPARIKKAYKERKAIMIGRFEVTFFRYPGTQYFPTIITNNENLEWFRTCNDSEYRKALYEVVDRLRSLGCYPKTETI